MEHTPWANVIPLQTLSTPSCCIGGLGPWCSASHSGGLSKSLPYMKQFWKASKITFLLFACICMYRSDSARDLDLIPGQGQSARLTSFWTDRLRNKEASSRPWGFRSFRAKRWSPWKNKHPRRGGPCHWATLQWDTAFNVSVRLCLQDTDGGSLLTIASFFSYVTPHLKQTDSIFC